MSGIAIIYFDTGVIDKKTSSIKKYIHQFEGFHKICPTHLFIVCQQIKESLIEELPDQVTIIQKSTKIFKNINAIFLLKRLAKELDICKPDYIYFRYATYYPYFYRAINKKYAKSFAEIQSKLFDEIELMNENKSLRESLLLLREKILARRYLRNLNGLITITNEIKNYEKQFNPNLKMHAIGNGFSGSNKEGKKIDNGIIDLLFIGTPGQPWHNVERLLKSFEDYKMKTGDNNTFKIHIVGMNKDDLKYQSHTDNVSFYGYISDPVKYNEIYQKADIGVGTLGLYKKNMKEAAPLKVREYLAYGLPVIVGYKDVDLSKDLPFIMQIENSDDVIDFSKIIKFYEDFKRYSSEETVKKFCAANLTWDKKCKEIIDFMNAC